MNEDTITEFEHELQQESAQEMMEAEEAHGWPGDGSGEDDLADHNANEADDYRYEGDDAGMEDQHLDSSWEDRFEIEMGSEW